MDRTEVTPDVSAIRTVFESWYCAIEDGDVDRLISLVTPDVIVKPPGAAPIMGKSVLRHALSAFLKEQTETVDYKVQEVEVSGQLAFARILESATIRPRSGAESSTMTGIHLTILRCQPDGEWLVARDIMSLVDTT
jgi:uncharacterized protein (TIGR02246 family)